MSVVETEMKFNFVIKLWISSIMRGKGFQQKHAVKDVEFSTIPKVRNLYKKNAFFSPIYTFSLAGNINV